MCSLYASQAPPTPQLDCLSLPALLPQCSMGPRMAWEESVTKDRGAAQKCGGHAWYSRLRFGHTEICNSEMHWLAELLFFLLRTFSDPFGKTSGRALHWCSQEGLRFICERHQPGNFSPILHNGCRRCY